MDEKILDLLSIIEAFPGKLSYFEFIRLACEARLFPAVLSLGFLALKVVEEHNNHVE